MNTDNENSSIQDFQEKFSNTDGYQMMALVIRGFKKILIGNIEHSHDILNKYNFRFVKNIFARNLNNDIESIKIDNGDFNIIVFFINSFKVPVYLLVVIKKDLSADIVQEEIKYAISKFLDEENVYDYLIKNMLDTSSLKFPYLGTTSLENTQEQELPPFMRTESVLRMLKLRESEPLL